jgi:plastocyanin
MRGAIATVAALAAMVPACAIGLGAHDAPQARTHTVTMESMRFQPKSLTVARGDTVVWVNQDLFPHTATSKTGGFDSQAIQPEKAWSVTLRKKGAFDYACTFHPTMTATLWVE